MICKSDSNCPIYLKVGSGMGRKINAKSLRCGHRCFKRRGARGRGQANREDVESLCFALSARERAAVDVAQADENQSVNLVCRRVQVGVKPS